jgi:hypothetical protein
MILKHTNENAYAELLPYPLNLLDVPARRHPRQSRADRFVILVPACTPSGRTLNLETHAKSILLKICEHWLVCMPAESGTKDGNWRYDNGVRSLSVSGGHLA